MEEQILTQRFNEFQSIARELVSKPKGLESELYTKQARLKRLQEARSAQLALEETEKAEILEHEIEKLFMQVEILQAKLKAFGPGGKSSAQRIVASAPDSDLHVMALLIVDEAAELAGPLEKELQEFVNYGADMLKEEYLGKIRAFAVKLSELWEISFAGLTCQTYLPKECRKMNKPRLIAPDQSHFEIDVMKIGEVYHPLSRTRLPD